MITLISTPAYPELPPSDILRVLATESPNNFRLLRQDWIVISSSPYGGMLVVELSEVYTGQIGNEIACYDETTNQIYLGEVDDFQPTFILTSIPYVAGMSITYVNDFREKAGYYFEGRLTVNNVLYPLTIIASPDSFGYADLDVSGILRIVTSIGKTGNYTSRIIEEPTKSGSFSLEYRECWYGSNEDWTQAEGVGSPQSVITWYYVEAVRSEEQGSNLHEYITTGIKDAPFFNSFTSPVYFRGLPFDISFYLPDLGDASPYPDVYVEINSFNAQDELLNNYTAWVNTAGLEGLLCSLNINDTIIPAGTDFFTAEIFLPD